MDSPREEIIGAVTRITCATSADAQKFAMLKYFTKDIGFKHPLCAVRPGPNSRTHLMGIYQWYRTMSPTIDATVNDMFYDAEKNVAILDITQRFHIRISPFSAAPARLITRLQLREVNGKHYIAFQEDWYHPGDLMTLILPPLARFIPLIHFFATLFSMLGAWAIGGVLGLWRPQSGPSLDGTDGWRSHVSKRDISKQDRNDPENRQEADTNGTQEDSHYIELSDKSKVWSSTANTDIKAEKGLDI